MTYFAEIQYFDFKKPLSKSLKIFSKNVLFPNKFTNFAVPKMSR